MNLRTFSRALILSLVAWLGFAQLSIAADARIDRLPSRIQSEDSNARPQASGTLSAAPKKSKFEACCSACPAGGCTGCNAHPNTPHLSCGGGLIKANCQVVDNVATCIRPD